MNNSVSPLSHVSREEIILIAEFLAPSKIEAVVDSLPPGAFREMSSNLSEVADLRPVKWRLDSNSRGKGLLEQIISLIK